MSGLVFTSPFVLTALLALPVLWWLLRLTPPAPKVVAFPPTRILHELPQREESAAKSPLWLTLMRLLIATLIILALAGPMAAPTVPVSAGSGPLLLIVDNGWASKDWSVRREAIEQALDQAERDDRVVVLAPTADPALTSGPADAQAVREVADSLNALPHPPLRGDIATRLTADAIAAPAPYDVVWLSDGLAHDADGDAALLDALVSLDGDGVVTIVAPDEASLPLGQIGARNGSSAMIVTVARANTASVSVGEVQAFDAKGRLIDTAPFAFEGENLTAQASFDRPIELRNTFRRLEIAGAGTAAGVYLLDNRNERRTVGLVDGTAGDADQPLLSSAHYIGNALAPFSDVRRAPDRNVENAIQRMVDQGVSIIVLTDIGTIPDASADLLAEWVDTGGMLIRFAGPRLAASDDNRLLPVALRRGGRTLGGTLSWSEPRRIDTFPQTSPFSGVSIEAGTTVARQVLATPSIELADRSWAQLDDGTPLVTGTRSGEGFLVLFHIAADQRWSNLPLSGTFVEMMHRLAELAGAPRDAASGGEEGTAADPSGLIETDAANLLAPFQTLDATGRLGDPPARTQPLSADGQPTAVGMDHPPGFYGPSDALRALNIADETFQLSPLAFDPAVAQVRPYPSSEPVDFAPWLLLAAILILFADAIAVLWITGRIGHRIAAPTAAALAVLVVVAAKPVSAQEMIGDDLALAAANGTRLAYVTTQDESLNAMTRAGLRGLTAVLTARTALEPEDPIGIDIARDELAFFPLLYWNVSETDGKPEASTLARLDAYMKQGGTILFDTRDASISAFSEQAGVTSPTTRALRAILADLDVPALEPVPTDHVLTKSFYLLSSFPGRSDAGRLWVEAAVTEADVDRPAQAGDGVSSIMITSNDLAGAWAISADGRPLLPMSMAIPGQREIAFRSGVNIVMYTLTGNYKADQVHIPALLERLGQ